jgi:hypothetical protein
MQQYQQYSVNQYQIANVLNSIETKQIAIPEIQRPFVWDSTKVRDLIDSLYKGFPIGYVITWQNPSINLKNGTSSMGKQILIDGQQRITALTTAIKGYKIIDSDYNERRIIIAFHPIKEEFRTLDNATKKNSEWVHDIAEYMNTYSQMEFIREYFEKNPEFTNEQKRIIEKNLGKLSNIKSAQVGFIELDSNLPIEDVTEIFVRINSKGVRLAETDFAMSKIASYEPASESDYGQNLRKCIDYFSHLALHPEFFTILRDRDTSFVNSEYFPHIRWLKDEKDDLYDPDYNDILRVSFVKEFHRGRISDLVKLLSGQNFETRKYEESIQTESFEKLQKAVLDFSRENYFKNYLLILRSLGIVKNNLINSKNVINFGYILYLFLRDRGAPENEIQKHVRKWIIISVLTRRYSGSPESVMDYDMKQISAKGIEKVIEEEERINLSEAYWTDGIIRDLQSASASNPFLKLFWIAQIYFKNNALFSESVKVEDLIQVKGDIHHIFPREHLKSKGHPRIDYNQVSNFAYVEQPINIKIGKQDPKDYFSAILQQTKDKKAVYGMITDDEILKENLLQNAIPMEILTEEMDYWVFLDARKKLMAEKIKKYYKSL